MDKERTARKKTSEFTSEGARTIRSGKRGPGDFYKREKSIEREIPMGEKSKGKLQTRNRKKVLKKKKKRKCGLVAPLREKGRGRRSLGEKEKTCRLLHHLTNHGV